MTTRWRPCGAVVFDRGWGGWVGGRPRQLDVGWGCGWRQGGEPTASWGWVNGWEGGQVVADSYMVRLTCGGGVPEHCTAKHTLTHPSRVLS